MPMRSNRPRICRLACGVVLVTALAGCQFGKYTAELKTSHFLPRLQLNKLPPQWEPPVAPEGTGPSQADRVSPGTSR